MKQHTKKQRGSARGFSLLELLISVALTSIIMGAVLDQISQTQQRGRAEQVKVDIFQEARDFADEFVRDLHDAGYPSAHMFDTSGWSPAVASPSYSDSRLATGVILIGPAEIEFEGDVDGTGGVSVLTYELVATGNNCPCLQRSQVLKSSGGTVFSNQVQNVESAGTTADPIFVGYTNTGTTVTTADLTTLAGQQALATIKTVQIRIKIKAGVVDPQTGLAAETTLGGQVNISNCSLAATGQTNSC